MRRAGVAALAAPVVAAVLSTAVLRTAVLCTAVHPAAASTALRAATAPVASTAAALFVGRFGGCFAFEGCSVEFSLQVFVVGASVFTSVTGGGSQGVLPSKETGVSC